MKYCILFLLCASFIIIASGQNKMVKSKEFYQSLHCTKSSWIIVSGIKVNNSEKEYRFILDTGSTDSSISEELCSVLGIKKVGTNSVSDGTTKQLIDYGVANINIAGIDFDNVQVDIINLAYLNNFECDIDGIIGLNLMKQCAWKITKDSIIISNRIKNFDLRNYEKLKFSVDNSPKVRIELLRNYQSDVLLDLGDNNLFTINYESAKYLRKDKKNTGKGLHSSTTFGNKETQTAEIFKPSGSFIFYKTKMILPDIIAEVNYDIDGSDVIGAGILDYFNFIIDFSKEELFAEQNRNIIDNDRLDTFGFTCVVENNHVIVGFLWDNSSAQKAGIKLNDEIYSINNLSFDNILQLSTCEIYNQIRQELKKETILLKIRDQGGKEKIYELKKERIL